MHPRMKRWSDDRLDKELAFARSARDENHPANLDWLRACEKEMKRRKAIHPPETKTQPHR